MRWAADDIFRKPTINILQNFGEKNYLESKKRLSFKQEMAHLGKEAGCGERKWAGPDEKRLDKWVKGH